MQLSKLKNNGIAPKEDIKDIAYSELEKNLTALKKAKRFTKIASDVYLEYISRSKSEEKIKEVKDNAKLASNLFDSLLEYADFDFSEDKIINDTMFIQFKINKLENKLAQFNQTKTFIVTAGRIYSTYIFDTGIIDYYKQVKNDFAETLNTIGIYKELYENELEELYDMLGIIDSEKQEKIEAR